MNSKPQKLRFGYFSPKLNAQYQNLIWSGMVEYAALNDIDLICFPGERIKSPHNFEYQANILYEIAGTENLDGLIILTNAIGPVLDHPSLAHFCRSYRPLPTVSIGFPVPDLSSVEIDNIIGMRQLIDHLVSVHHYHEFAFIGGPENNIESSSRYETMIKLLAEYNIDFKSEMRYTGNFLQESGSKAIEYFLDQIKKPIDVIVAANDYMALGALEALQARGISVPDQIAVVGFDDIYSSRYCTPPLTTVHQPNYEVGRQSLALLIDLIARRPRVDYVKLPSYLVIRQSCGCFHHETKYIVSDDHGNLDMANQQEMEMVKEGIIDSASAALSYAGYTDDEDIKKLWVETMVQSFFYDLQNKDTNSFITSINELLRNLVIKKRDIFVWHKILFIIRDQFLRFNVTRDVLLKAEFLWDKARILIGDVSQRNQGFMAMETERLSHRLWEISNALITSFELDKLIEVVDRSVKMLKIELCFFSIYDTGNSISNTCRLIYCFYKNQSHYLYKENYLYPSRELIPQKFKEHSQGINLIVLPLYFHTDQLGYIVFQLGDIDYAVFDVLRQQISSALKGAWLMNEIKGHAIHLEQQISERTTDLIRTNHKLEKEIRKRLKVDMALQESELNLRAITEATPIPLAIVKQDQGGLLYANKAFCSRFAIAEEDVMNYEIKNFFSDAVDLKVFIQDVSTLANHELQAMDAKGRSFSVVASFQFMTFMHKKAILCGFYDITERKRLEREILEISGREQRRIGQDLHDDLCQSLAGIAVMISALANNLRDHDEESASKAVTISAHINDAIARTRSLARGLYPAALEENGLAYMLEELAQKIKVQFAIQCELIIREPEVLNDNTQVLHLYRICQEAVNNAIRHGKTPDLTIEFLSTKDKIHLAVRDNGIGFPKNLPSGRGMGLRIMHYRANIIGAKINIKKNGIKGTCLSCTINRKK